MRVTHASARRNKGQRITMTMTGRRRTASETHWALKSPPVGFISFTHTILLPGSPFVQWQFAPTWTIKDFWWFVSQNYHCRDKTRPAIHNLDCNHFWRGLAEIKQFSDVEQAHLRRPNGFRIPAHTSAFLKKDRRGERSPRETFIGPDWPLSTTETQVWRTSVWQKLALTILVQQLSQQKLCSFVFITESVGMFALVLLSAAQTLISKKG